MKKLLLITILTIFVHNIYAQKQKFGLIAFYNLENLFDTIHDENKNDYEYLPDGKKQWNTEKYLAKLSHMSEAIAAIGNDKAHCPAILGVAEVENASVLKDLCSQKAIKSFDFDFIQVEGPDRRGIDVAMLYQKSKFKVLGYKSYRLKIPESPNTLTRDQLLVTGLFLGDTIHILICHWPSRLGGKEKSSSSRASAAMLSRSIVDSLISINANKKIFIMGDLNDDPIDESVLMVLNANGDSSGLQKGELYNPMYNIFTSGKGTLEYKGKWNLFDQIIVSNALINDSKGIKLYKKTAYIFDDEMLKQKEGKYTGIPLRTYSGNKWLNGYSDHFPSYILLITSK